MATLLSQNHKFDRSIIKIIFLAVFGIISIYFFGHYLSLTFNSAIENRMMLFSFIAVAFYLIFFFFQSIFIKSFWQGNLIILLEIATFAFAFRSHFSMPILLGFVLFFLVLMIGRFAVKKEIENNLRVSFIKVNRLAFGYTIIAISIFLAILVGVIFTNSSISLEKILNPITGLTNKIFSGTDSSGFSNNSMVNYIVRQQLDKDPKFNALPESQKNLVINQAMSEFKGFNPIGGIFSGLNDFFANMNEQTKMLVAIIIAVLVFWAIKSTLVLLSWPITLIAFLLYELLLATNFAKISVEQREKEILSL